MSLVSLVTSNTITIFHSCEWLTTRNVWGHAPVTLVMEERDKTDLHFAAHTMSILSEEIFNSMVHDSPFHEENSKMGQKAQQKSLGKIAFREDWSPSFFLSILESITLSWVLSHSFSIVHFFNEISFFCVPFYNHTTKLQCHIQFCSSKWGRKQKKWFLSMGSWWCFSKAENQEFSHHLLLQ